MGKHRNMPIRKTNKKGVSFLPERRDEKDTKKTGNEDIISYLYLAYKRHVDIFHTEPDKIADIAIVDVAYEKAIKKGMDISFENILEIYRKNEDVFSRRYNNERRA